MDYHTTYVAPEGETTEWEDILVKKGIWEERPKPPKPEKFTPEQEKDKVGSQAWIEVCFRYIIPSNGWNYDVS